MAWGNNRNDRNRGGQQGGGGQQGPPQGHVVHPEEINGGPVAGSEVTRFNDYGDRTAIVSQTQAAASEEIRVAMTVAHSKRRSEDAARQKILTSCKRKAFADECTYEFKRGDTTVSGPSIVMMRELARLWGNIRFGIRIVADDDRSRSIVGWAWDLETNAYEEQADTFRKLIQRKRGGQTIWVVPDERDLRELTNRRGAVCVRNCITHLMPFDLIREIEEAAAATMSAEMERDPTVARRDVTDSFATLNVPVDELEEFLGHSLGSASPKELSRLRGIYKAIASGEAAWVDYFKRQAPNTVVAGAEAMAGFTGAAATQGQRGGSDDRQATLPTNLRPDAGDPRSIPEYLLDIIPVVDLVDLEAIARALPNLKLKAVDVQKIAVAIGEARSSFNDSDDGGDAGPGEQASEAPPEEKAPPRKPRTPPPPVEKDSPPDVQRLMVEIRKAKGELQLGVAMRKWRDLLNEVPDFEEFNQRVEAAIERQAAALREAKS